MPSREEVLTLRQSATDDAVLNYLYAQDAGFKATVDRVRERNPSMSEFEKVKFPSAILDIHYGPKSPRKPVQNPMTTQMVAVAAETPKEKSIVGFGGNILKSGAQFGRDAWSAISNPVETATTIGKAAIGGVVNAGESIASALGKNDAENVINAPGEDIASRIGDFYKERYGSAEAIGNTFYNDPVGFAADLAGLLSGGGTALSKLGNLSTVSSIAKVGEKIASVGKMIDPVMAAGKAVGSAARIPGAAAEKLISSSLKLNASDVKKIARMNVAGTTPEAWLREKGIIGLLGDSPDSLSSKLDELANSSKASLDTGLSRIRQLYDIQSGKPNGALRVGQAIDSLKTTFGEIPGNEDLLGRLSELQRKRMLTLSEINEVKRILDREIGVYSKSGEVKAGAAARGLKNVRSDIQAFIEKQAAQNGFANVKSLNKDTQVATGIKNAIANSAARRVGNRVLSLTDLIVGTVAGVGIDPVTGLGIVIGKKFLESPRLKTAIAKVISALSPDQLSILDEFKATKNVTARVKTLLQKIIDEAEKLPESAIIEGSMVPERSND